MPNHKRAGTRRPCGIMRAALLSPPFLVLAEASVSFVLACPLHLLPCPLSLSQQAAPCTPLLAPPLQASFTTFFHDIQGLHGCI